MQMLDLAAFDTFGVKMLSAITARTNVLVHTAFFILTPKHPQNVLTAKLSKLAVQAAPSAFRISVQADAQLFHRKLAIGVRLKKANQPLPPLRFVCPLHLVPLISHNLRIILKLYHTRRILSIGFLKNPRRNVCFYDSNVRKMSAIIC